MSRLIVYIFDALPRLPMAIALSLILALPTKSAIAGVRSISGEIESISVADKSLTVLRASTFSEERLKLKVIDSTAITFEGKAASLGDLGKKQLVNAFYDDETMAASKIAAKPSKSEAAKAKKADGGDGAANEERRIKRVLGIVDTIAMLDKNRISIRIRDLADGKLVTLIDRPGRLIRLGRMGSGEIRSLRQGHLVRIDYGAETKAIRSACAFGSISAVDDDDKSEESLRESICAAISEIDPAKYRFCEPPPYCIPVIATMKQLAKRKDVYPHTHREAVGAIIELGDPSASIDYFLRFTSLKGDAIGLISGIEEITSEISFRLALADRPDLAIQVLADSQCGTTEASSPALGLIALKAQKKGQDEIASAIVSHLQLTANTVPDEERELLSSALAMALVATGQLKDAIRVKRSAWTKCGEVEDQEAMKAIARVGGQSAVLNASAIKDPKDDILSWSMMMHDVFLAALEIKSESLAESTIESVEIVFKNPVAGKFVGWRPSVLKAELARFYFRKENPDEAQLLLSEAVEAEKSTDSLICHLTGIARVQAGIGDVDAANETLSANLKKIKNGSDPLLTDRLVQHLSAFGLLVDPDDKKSMTAAVTILREVSPYRKDKPGVSSGYWRGYGSSCLTLFGVEPTLQHVESLRRSVPEFNPSAESLMLLGICEELKTASDYPWLVERWKKTAAIDIDKILRSGGQ